MTQLIVTRRAALGALAGALSLGHQAIQAAEAWPTRTVRIIVPFAPGGGSDMSARALAELLAPQLGQSVIVENRPGAGSALGVNAAAQSKDRHTLLMGSNSMVINPSLNAQIGYDVARDFDAIGMVSAQPLVLVVPASSPIKSLADLVAQAKAQPGKLTAGNSGNGTLAHIAAETGTGEELLERGRRKLRRKGADLLAVNEVGWTKGFEATDNHLIVLDRTDEVVADAAGSKRAVADALLDAVVSYRSGQSSSGISS